MIVLDTNVLSALMRKVPEAAVVSWLDQQPADSIWITAITVFEARFGIAALPPGRRRRALEDALERMLTEDLDNRVLEFDAASAAAAATLAADRRAGGRPVELRDTLIAGIAIARRATLATRNVRHFGDLSVPVVDPARRESDAISDSVAGALSPRRHTQILQGRRAVRQRD